MAAEHAGSSRLYTAFLSYSHAADGRLAPAIQSGWHKFARPWYRLRALLIFRDKTSLSASPALWPSIERALESSEWLLLLASPEAAASRWVRQEIEWWLAHRPPETMLVILTDGELAWNAAERDFDWNATTALPPLLSGTFRDEPLYVDLRWARKSEELSLRHTQFRAAIIDLASPLHGRPKDELDGEDVRQHRRTRRITWAASSLLVLLTIASVLAAYVAIAQRRVAVRQSQIALSRLLAVESNRMLDQQLDVALLLAAAADESAPTIEARAALRSAFQRSPRLLRFLGAGRGRVFAVAATRGTDTLLSIAENGTLAAWSRNSGKLLSTARPTEKRVTAAAFDATGTALALGAADGAIVVVDPATRRTVSFPTGHSRAVTILGFSRDGRTLASAGGDGIVAVWDPATGRRKDYGGIRGTEVTSIALSPDGARVAANVLGPGPARVVIAAVGGDAPPAELPGASGRSDVVFGPDGTTLIFGDQEERVAVWDVIAKRRLRLLRGPDSWITSLAIHPDGTKIVTGRGDGALLLWDLTKGEEPEELEEHLQGVREVAFSPDGTRLASRAGLQVILHNVQDPRRFVTLDGHLGEVETMGFESGGDVLVTGDRNGQVLVWGLNAGRQADVVVLGNGSMGTGEVHSVAFHPDGTLAAGWGAGAITLWDLGRGRPVRVLDSQQSSVISMSFSPDGRALAAASLDDTVKLLDVATGAVLADWTGHTGKIVSVAFRPDGKAMAAQRDPASIGFWDVERRMEGPPFRPGGAAGEILSLAFRGDGSLLAAGLGDGRVVLTTATGDREIRAVEARHGGVVSLAFSPDGRTLASGNRDGSIVVWDVASGSERVVMRRHERGVTSVAFTPDGSQLASSSIDGTVVIWNPVTGLPGVVLDADDSLVMGLAVSRDGAWLAAGSLDGKVRIWDARVDTWRLHACEIANRQLTPREWATHVGDEVPYRAVCPP